MKSLLQLIDNSIPFQFQEGHIKGHQTVCANLKRTDPCATKVTVEIQQISEQVNNIVDTMNSLSRAYEISYNHNAMAKCDSSHIMFS